MVKKIRRYLVYLAARTLIGITWYLSFEMKSSIGAAGGLLSFLILKKDRRRAMENFRFALGSKYSDNDIRKIVRTAFINLGRNALEALHIPRLNLSNLKNYITFEGLEHVEEGLRKGKGIVVITGHLGNWELFSTTVSMIGYPVTIIARRYSNPWIDGMIKNFRASHGTNVIIRKKGYESQMMKEALKALRQNGILGLLIDQYTRKGSVCVDFFGRLATAPIGPAIFAARTEATVLPGCVIRKNKYRHIVKFYPPAEVVNTGDREKDIYVNTANFTKAIEMMVSEYPSQWAWTHDRWKMKSKGQRAKSMGYGVMEVGKLGSYEVPSPLEGEGKGEGDKTANTNQPSVLSSQHSKSTTRHTSHVTDSLPLVEIYSKPDCCLCDQAKEILLKVQKTHPFTLEEIDISLDKTLLEKYKEEIPVIFINGRKVFKFRLTEEEMIKKLRA